jgi:hypothetical protein
MTFESLDIDTQSIVKALCLQTGFTQTDAVRFLIEMGMLAMKAAGCPDAQGKVHQRIFDIVNRDPKLKATAEIYDAVWSISPSEQV